MVAGMKVKISRNKGTSDNKGKVGKKTSWNKDVRVSGLRKEVTDRLTN